MLGRRVSSYVQLLAVKGKGRGDQETLLYMGIRQKLEKDNGYMHRDSEFLISVLEQSISLSLKTPNVIITPVFLIRIFIEFGRK